jgi:hypothetical protein
VRTLPAEGTRPGTAHWQVDVDAELIEALLWSQFPALAGKVRIVNAARKLTPCRRLKIDPLVVFLFVCE